MPYLPGITIFIGVEMKAWTVLGPHCYCTEGSPTFIPTVSDGNSPAVSSTRNSSGVQCYLQTKAFLLTLDLTSE